MNLGSFLDTVKLFQVLLYKCHNFILIICLHTVCSIWTIHRTISGATTLGQSVPGSNNNEWIHYISQID